MEKKLSAKKFTEAMLSQEKTIEILKKIEEIKADVLSDLSDPWKATRERIDTIIDLEVQKYKIIDYVEVDMETDDEVFKAACIHYDLLKKPTEESKLSRDAQLIQLNAK